MDKENLAKDDASEDSLSSALQRLSMRTDPDVKEYIKKYADHPAPQVKAAAAESAGSFLNEEGYLEIIQEALRSSNETVRIGALRGLSRQGGEENEKMVLNHLKKTGLSADESFQANLTLLKVATVPQRRQEALQKLIQMSEKSGSADRLADVFLFAPNEPLLVEKAKTIFSEGTRPELTARAMQYLIAYDKGWMAQHIAEAPMLDSLKYQLVLLDALRTLCPPERKAMLEKLKASASNAEVHKGVDSFSCP